MTPCNIEASEGKDPVNTEQIAKELLVALRGKRSQVQWSRRLGYKSNVAYTWEKGRRWPTGAETLRACRRNHLDVAEAIRSFYGKDPAWLGQHDPASPEGVAAMLDDLRGSLSLTDLARRAGVSRSRVSRWLGGQTQPRLPDFLTMVEATSLRLVDFLSELVPPAQLPSVLPTWERLEARRNGAIRYPWTQAIVRCLELETYRALPRHEPGWIATHLGIDEQIEAECLDFLHDTGQVAWTGSHYAQRPFAVDNRSHPEDWRIRAHWSQVAATRIQRGAPGQFSYNVFTCSRSDLERIRQAHLQYYRELRAIVADSEPGEVVAVANVQLFALDG